MLGHAEVPVYGHLPLVLGADGQRLAKRGSGTTIRELVASAIRPTAIIGMLARELGLTRAAGPLTPAEVAASLRPPMDGTEAWPMGRAPDGAPTRVWF